jgi:hypothetical protein
MTAHGGVPRLGRRASSGKKVEADSVRLSRDVLAGARWLVATAGDAE